MYDTYARYAKARYAIQRIDNGVVVDKCETLEQAKWWIEHYKDTLEVIDTLGKSCITVCYAEMGGPNGYGHSEESFRTYGSIVRCLINLGKFIQENTKVFGPDPRDVYDYFRYCSLSVNGKDKSDWFHKNITRKINYKTLYI